MDTKELLFIYSEELRLRILLLLWNCEICVNCLEAVLQTPQSTISRHLGILRRAGAIVPRRNAQNIYYTVNKSAHGNLHKRLLSVYISELKDTEPYRSDRERLLKQKYVCTVDCKIA